ncbi:DUF6343 family protein, partial [Streptomyces sp. NPDC000971]|uniref:DUF6343 family protein n=1 Tax=Streptomyces sp. NPDC000971 TaxID=3156647 RepID=UPI00331F73FC
VRHLRQGPRYQPGRDVPPYEPDRGGPRGAPAGDCESYLDGDHLFRTTTKSASSVSCARTRSGMSTPCSASMATAC